MLRCGNTGLSSLIGPIIIVAIAMVIILIFLPSGPKPPIEVTCHLEPLTIRENERSVLRLTFNNLDLRTHEIKILFHTSQRILIYEGNEELLQGYAYTFVLEASDRSEERVFTLGGSLEAGTLSSQYPILFSVYVDGKELSKNWDAPVLTIQKD